MDIEITPHLLKGKVAIPSSKSVAHRMLICAALSNGVSDISGVTMSKDINATIDALRNIGAEIKINDTDISVKGIDFTQADASINCFESGSTLRFLIPIVCALGISAQFLGEGKLPQRPITPYIRELSTKGVSFRYENTMPFSVSGRLSGGTFKIEGDISSQFITGLLFALPLCKEDSDIILTSPLQSRPYVDLTIESLHKFGINIAETVDGFHISGNQEYNPISTKVEGDYSQAAFYYVANSLGSDIEMTNLSSDSIQGDKKIVEISSSMRYNKKGSQQNFIIDVSDIPDLVPVLAVLGCFGNKTSELTNASRLRIKESDRLEAIRSVLNSIGGNIEVVGDSLLIHPIEHFTGGIVDSFNDHRIVMAASIAATKSTNPIIIKNAQAVAKSYPDFFTDYNKLGGNANVINLE